MKIKSCNPLGTVRVPVLGRDVKVGEVVAFDVADDFQAAALESYLLQPANWEPADKEARDLLAHLLNPNDDPEEES